MGNLSKQYAQQWRQKRKDAGMCCSCSRLPARPGKRQCEVCAAKRRERERSRNAKGLCGCGKPSLQGRSKCQDCRDRHNEYIKKPQNKRRWSQGVNEKNRERRLLVLSHYGGKCVCCGESQAPFLTLDHINNDGKRDREAVHSGYWWRWVVKQGFPSHLQVLCWNCNMAKQHFGNGVCPHQLARLVETTSET